MKRIVALPMSKDELKNNGIDSKSLYEYIQKLTNNASDKQLSDMTGYSSTVFYNLRGNRGGAYPNPKMTERFVRTIPGFSEENLLEYIMESSNGQISFEDLDQDFKAEIKDFRKNK